MYHIEVQRSIHRYALEVFIRESIERKQLRIKFDNDGRMVKEEMEECGVWEPTFIIQLDEAKELLPKLIDALSDHVEPTDNDFKIKGTLEATRTHLKDLRYMLKLPKEI